jgi:xylulokinase
MDPTTGRWSAAMADRMGLEVKSWHRFARPGHLGSVSRVAATQTGLRVGTPVIVGGADYPVALLGSGVPSWISIGRDRHLVHHHPHRAEATRS